MLRHLVGHALFAALAAIALIVDVTPAAADPQHPTLAEVNSIVDVLRFRGTMQSDPAKAISAYSVDYGRASLNGIDKQMKSAGINTGAGWRYLLGTAVFTAHGVGQQKMLVVFYNPWVDSALFTVWQAGGRPARIVDAAWVPGDLARKARAEIDPRPLWLRANGYRPDTLAQAVIATTKAIEARFADPKTIGTWRKTLGIEDTRTYDRLVAPMLALTLEEVLLRLRTLALPAKGEAATMVPLRDAALAFIRTAQTKGFGPLLKVATDTTPTARAALDRINPKTMTGLAPVAYVTGKGQVTMFFVSTATADYAIAARFAAPGKSYALAQVEIIPYAAIYQAAAHGR